MELGQVAISVTVGVFVAAITLVNHSNYVNLVTRLETDLKRRLRTLRLVVPNLRTMIHAWIGIVCALFFLLGIGFDAFPLAFLLACLLCTGPWYLVRRLALIRKQKIEDQLADAMVMFSGGIRAGLSLAQSLELLATDCPRPIRQEFSQLVSEYRMGKPLERTLSEAKTRLRSENFILFAAALLASRESGGKLNETVERISKSVLEMQRLSRKIKSETAQARKSAIYMAIVPPLILIAYAWLDPNNVRLLFITLPGQILLSVAALLNLTAYLWAIKILSPQI